MSNRGTVMQRYRFIVFDEHKLIVETREYPATNDGTAVEVAAGWCDVLGGQVWRGDELIKHWRRGSVRFRSEAGRKRRCVG